VELHRAGQPGLNERAAVDTRGEPAVLESVGDRRTELVRLAPGQQLSPAGFVDIVVLTGRLGPHRARSYVRTNDPMVTATGCTALVKQRPGSAGGCAIDLATAAFEPPSETGVARSVLYEDGRGRVVLLRFAPGAAIPMHGHAHGEEFFVLDGELVDDAGTYTPNWWVRQPAGSTHAVTSPRGCLTFVIADHLPDATRVVDGRYRIDALLSRSAKAEVYAATHLTGPRVALKLLRGTQPADVVMRFRHEARVMAELAGSHAPRIIDFGVLPDRRTYIVTALLEGAPVAFPMPPAQAADVGRQVCVALARMHALGFVHRDVKPANLFATASEIVLLSYGVTGRYDATIRSRGLLGSPAYMAPEQLDGRAEPRSDLWSLGATLYQLVSGRVPFEAPTLEALIAIACNEPHVPLGGPLGAVIDRCLAKDPAQRYASAAELAAALAPHE
jgi:hypothetical protein